MARAQDNVSATEVLRRWGIRSSDVTRITRAVEEGVIAQFKASRSRRPSVEFSEEGDVSFKVREGAIGRDGN